MVIRDITDRSLRHLQEQFIGLVGHELRTPLTGVMGQLQLLRRILAREGTADRLDRSAEAALRQAERAITETIEHHAHVRLRGVVAERLAPAGPG